jgi:hypothetical protein
LTFRGKRPNEAGCQANSHGVTGSVVLSRHGAREYLQDSSSESRNLNGGVGSESKRFTQCRRMNMTRAGTQAILLRGDGSYQDSNGLSQGTLPSRVKYCGRSVTDKENAREDRECFPAISMETVSEGVDNPSSSADKRARDWVRSPGYVTCRSSSEVIANPSQPALDISRRCRRQPEVRRAGYFGVRRRGCSVSCSNVRVGVWRSFQDVCAPGSKYGSRKSRSPSIRALAPAAVLSSTCQPPPLTFRDNPWLELSNS